MVENEPLIGKPDNEPILGRYGKYVEITDLTEISNATTIHKAIIDDVDSNYSQLGHTHTKSNITDFSHTHTKSEITDFSHTHTSSEVTGFEWVDRTDELNTTIQQYCTFEVNDGLRLACLSYSRGDLRLNTGTTVSNVGVPTDYIPSHHVRRVFSKDIYFTLFGVGSTEQGNIGFGNSSGSATTPHINFQIMWHY